MSGKDCTIAQCHIYNDVSHVIHAHYYSDNHIKYVLCFQHNVTWQHMTVHGRLVELLLYLGCCYIKKITYHCTTCV